MSDGKLTVYHPETGEPYTGEPVDAREMCNLHGYTKEAPVQTSAVAESTDTNVPLTHDILATHTVSELKEMLNAKEIVYATNSLKEDLINLVLAS
jgi:hypothetical protein